MMDDTASLASPLQIGYHDTRELYTLYFVRFEDLLFSPHDPSSLNVERLELLFNGLAPAMRDTMSRRMVITSTRFNVTRLTSVKFSTTGKTLFERYNVVHDGSWFYASAKVAGSQYGFHSGHKMQLFVLGADWLGRSIEPGTAIGELDACRDTVFAPAWQHVIPQIFHLGSSGEAGKESVRSRPFERSSLLTHFATYGVKVAQVGRTNSDQYPRAVAFWRQHDDGSFTPRCFRIPREFDRSN